jgi:hypothetical protein
LRTSASMISIAANSARSGCLLPLTYEIFAANFVTKHAGQRLNGDCRSRCRTERGRVSK